MCTLIGFSALPPEGYISLYELDGKVRSVFHTGAESSLPSVVNKHPIVKITQEMLHATLYREGLKDVFVPVQEGFLKSLIQVWYDHGLAEALQSLATPTHFNVSPVLQKVASCLLKFAHGASQIFNVIYPHLRESGTKLIASVAQTRDWETCPIRCLAWHPYVTKLAVAAQDDSVRIFTSKSTVNCIVKCKNQRSISCLAWRPFSVSELAVGCEEGVYVWLLDPNSVMTHPSTSCATILKCPGHSPVISIAWSPQGDLLVSASAHDTTMYVWNVDLEISSAVRRVGGGGVCLVSWSPTGSQMFSASSSIVFRVWDTFKWIPEKWSVMSGRVQTACWSPCGTILLFATTEEYAIYFLSLSELKPLYQTNFETSQERAKRVVDTTPVETEDGEMLGGLVHSLTWDPHGFRLAVIFKNCDYVAVFETCISPVFSITPRCLVQGLKGEVPNAMSFQQNFKNGSILTIAWSTGRVQHFFMASSRYAYAVASPSLQASN